jgi:hypothetical protein
MVKTAFELLDAREDEAEEPKEAPVEAVPRLTRDVFGYHEPRTGIDGKSYFGQCGSCQFFVSEAAMTGAVYGNRCALFGAGFRITDDDSCFRFTPWAAGAPCEHVTAFYAAEIRKGLPGALSPFEVGYHGECATQCGSCRFGDRSDPETPPGKLECEAFEDMQEKAPLLFALEAIVDSFGGCNLWRCQPTIGDAVPGPPR